MTKMSLIPHISGRSPSGLRSLSALALDLKGTSMFQHSPTPSKFSHYNMDLYQIIWRCMGVNTNLEFQFMTKATAVSVRIFDMVILAFMTLWEAERSQSLQSH